MSEFEKIAVVRHLEDERDIKRFGLDGELKENQEELIDQIADNVIGLAKQEGSEYIHIFSSSHKRASETAVKLHKKIDSTGSMFSKLTIDSRVANLHQGIPNVPDNYEKGQSFGPLKEAWEIFWDETFNKKDLLYRFGSPKSSDGTRIFPQLDGKFLEYGECYAQIAERLYDFIYSLIIQETNVPLKRTVSLIGHSATLSVIYELIEIAKDYNNRFPTTPIPLGELPNITWQYFSKLKNSVLKNNPDYGEVVLCDIAQLKDAVFLENLSVERDFLRATMTQSNVRH